MINKNKSFLKVRIRTLQKLAYLLFCFSRLYNTCFCLVGYNVEASSRRGRKYLQFVLNQVGFATSSLPHLILPSVLVRLGQVQLPVGVKRVKVKFSPPPSPTRIKNMCLGIAPKPAGSFLVVFLNATHINFIYTYIRLKLRC